MPKTILVLSANPKSTDPLRLEREVRDIEEALQRAKERDNFVVKKEGALRTDDFRRAMLDHRPEIVHFSGHGAGEEGIVLEGDSGESKQVSTAALQDFFRSFAKIAPVECVVLNACYSTVQAEAIASTVKYVVGMSQAVGDDAAYDFAVGFYDGLGAGTSVEIAYELGCNNIQMDGSDEYTTPVLIVNGQIQAQQKRSKSSNREATQVDSAPGRTSTAKPQRSFTSQGEHQNQQAKPSTLARGSWALVYSLLFGAISAIISIFILQNLMSGITIGALLITAYQVITLVVTYVYGKIASNKAISSSTPRGWNHYLPLGLGVLLTLLSLTTYFFPATPEGPMEAMGLLLVSLGVVVWQIIKLMREHLHKANSS